MEYIPMIPVHGKGQQEDQEYNVALKYIPSFRSAWATRNMKHVFWRYSDTENAMVNAEH